MATDEPSAGGFLGVVTDRRTYRRMAYLALALPLGVGYFVVLTVGFALGMALSLVLLGIPLLVELLAAARRLANVERRLASRLLDVDVGRPPPVEADDVRVRARRLAGDPVTWTDVAFLYLKFPLGVVSFVLLAVLLPTAAALIAAPLLYPGVRYDFGVMVVDTLPEALLAAASGVALVVVSLHFVDGLARIWALTAEALLTPR